MKIQSSLTKTIVLIASLVFAPSLSWAATAHACAATLSRTILTQITSFKTQSTTFVNVPGAAAMVNVPAGQTRCVIVRFSASSSCSETSAFDVCTIRVVEPAKVALDPPLNGIDFADGSVGLAAHSFEWVKRFGPGKHTIVAQAAVQNSATTMSMPLWTMDVETTN